jgi:uncharacterized RDD family membrane protein YckC
MPPPPERFAEIMINQEPPKVIRFPRPQTAYAPAVDEIMLDELQPAGAPPRIYEADPDAADPETARLETDDVHAVRAEAEFEPGPPMASRERPPAMVSQQLDLLPCFDDIRLEPEEARSDDDLEIIPRPAPLAQRFVSGIVDAGIVFIATGVCALTFVELAEELPRSRMTVLCAAFAGAIFWLLLQYIFLAYRRATPGMRMAQLELCTFAGAPTAMFHRERRAWASALSALSIGLGYAWALVDEDRLGWHDRISQTYVRSCAIPSGAREPYGYDDLRS